MTTAHTQSRARTGTRRIPITDDLVFKAVFGRSENTEPLRALLSAIEEDDGSAPVLDVTILNPFNIQRDSLERLTVIDVRARDANGRVFSVEMQARAQAPFVERALYYWCASFGRQISSGQQYDQLKPVEVVSLLNFRLFDRSWDHRWHRSFDVRSRLPPHRAVSEHLVLHFLELPRFRLRREPSTSLERWVYFMKRAMTPEDPIMKTILEEDSAVAEAYERYKQFLSDPEAVAAFDAHRIFLSDQATMLANATKKGLEKGMRKGLEQGIEQGREQGVLETARAMKRRGMEPELIAECTGLSLERISEL